MGLFVILAAVLWGAGVLAGAPYRARFAMIGALYGGILVALLVLPEGNALRTGIGGTPGEWLVAGGAVVLIWLYSRALSALKARHKSKAPVQAGPGAFSGAELQRYARHIVLRELGGPGQRKLKQAQVLVVGAGGLGSPALLYLAAAGVGVVGVIDADKVDIANLQRQVIHRDQDIGTPKVFSAARAMGAQNPNVVVRPYHRRLSEPDAQELIAGYDLVLDGTDNADTRYLVNRACVAAGVPLVSGALSQWEGQISVFDPARGGPCYQCAFPEAAAPHLTPACAEAGVLGPLPGVIGTMMAVEAVKVIAGAGAPMLGTMLIYDALYGQTRSFRVKRRQGCPVCGHI